MATFLLCLGDNMIKKLYLIFRDLGQQMRQDNISAYAASMAFFFMLSIVPIFLILYQFVSHLPVSEQMLQAVIEEYTPGFLDSTLNAVWSQVDNQYMTILPIAIVVLLWSAGKAIWGMMMGLNACNKVVEDRNIILVRLWASFYSLIFLALLILCICMIVISEKMILKFNLLFPGISKWLYYFSDFRFIFIWAISVLFLTLLYKVIPNIKLKFKYQLPGAIIAATGWAIFSWGFSVYVDNFSAFSIYGGLSALFFILMWMYICMYLLLIGAYINCYFYKDISMIVDKKIAIKNISNIIKGK